MSKQNVSMNAFRTFFADSSAALAESVESLSAKEERTQQEERALKAMITRDKRYNKLSALSDAAVKLLNAQVKSKATDYETLAKSASYGLDKVAELLEALASDSLLTMKDARDGKRNISVALDYMKAKNVSHIMSSTLQRELMHATKTQAHYIERTLAALGVAERSKVESGEYQLKLIDSPITDKIRTLYGLES